MLRFLKAEFTLEKAASKVLWTAVFAVLTRALFWLLNVSLNHKELWYWLIIPALYLAAILTLTRIARGGGPSVAGTIEWVHVTETPPVVSTTPGALASIVLNVRNQGAPTSLEDWQLRVDIPGEKPLDGLPVGIGESVSYPLGPNVVTLYGSDALYVKLADKMLAKGERIRGILMFNFAGVHPLAIGKPGSILTVSVEDYEGRRCPIVYRWKAQPDPTPKFFTGMKVTVLPADPALPLIPAPPPGTAPPLPPPTPRTDTT